MDALFRFAATVSPLELGVTLAVTAAMVALVTDWRLALGSLMVQYLCFALLLDLELPENLALVRLVAGAVACINLYWTARHVETALDHMDDGRTWFLTRRDIYPMGMPFRFLALLFAALVLFTVPERFAIAAFPRAVFVPALWLLALGLLTIILTRDPLKTGMGLLTFSNGFELLYLRLERGLLVIGLLCALTILVSLVASYLAVARHLPAIEARRAVAKRPPDPRSAEALQQAVEALEQAPAQEAGESVEVGRRSEVPA